MSRKPRQRSNLPAGRPLPPPAPAGNLRAGTHLAFSARFVIPDADELVEVLYREVPHLRDEDYLAVRDFAISQVRVWRLEAWLAKNGDFDGRGRPRPALELQRRWLDRTERARGRLGLDPVGRATLNVDQSLVLARVRELELSELEEGRRLRKRAAKRRAT